MRAGARELQAIARSGPSPLLLAILLGCAPLEPPGAGPHEPPGAAAPTALAARSSPEHENGGRIADESAARRAARGLDSVHIVRSWKVPTAEGPTGLFLDVYNAGSWLVTGLVVDLYDEAGGARLRHTCQLAVVIPAGRVARVSCYKALAHPERVVPRIVDVHWH